MGYWISLVVGIVLPVVVYGFVYVRFHQKKAEWEKANGMPIHASWWKRMYSTGLAIYPVFLLINVVRVLNTSIVPTEGMPDYVSFVLTLLSIMNVFFLFGMLYHVHHGVRFSFYLSEFLTLQDLKCWENDSNLSILDFFGEDGELYLFSKVIHPDYISLIQGALPMLKEKRALSEILQNLRNRPLSEYEKEVLGQTQARFDSLNAALSNRWDDVLIAIGRYERPEVLDKRKEASVKAFEKMNQTVPVAPQKPADPALKELHALTQNEEAPDDLKQLAHNAIRDIEAKLEQERQSEKDEAIRRSAENIIRTSRQYHGLDA